MLDDEVMELTARLQALAKGRRHNWRPFCGALRLLQEYEQGQEKTEREVLAALVLVESTIEALEGTRLQAVERVALECARQVSREAWLRLEEDSMPGAGFTSTPRSL